MNFWSPYHFFKQKKASEIPDFGSICATTIGSTIENIFIGTADGAIYDINSPDDISLNLSDFEARGKVVHIEASSSSSRILVVSHNEEIGRYVFTICNTNDLIPMYECFLDANGNIELVSCSNDLNEVAFVMENSLMMLKFPEKDIDFLKHLNLHPTHIELNESEIITGVFFSFINEKKLKIIYVLTKESIYCMELNSLRIKQNKIDSNGYDPENNDKIAFIDENHQLYVCRKNVISIYSSKGRLLNEDIALDEKPILLYKFRHYIVSLSQTDSSKNILKIYDPKTHCIFGVNTVGNNVMNLFNVWGFLVIILDNGKIIFYDEPDAENIIIQLCQNYKQYDVAMKVAETQNLNPSIVSTIHHIKGDYYYDKQDYKLAMNEYIDAISHLEPSYVIKKYLDPKLANYLLEYLEALESKSYIIENKSLFTSLLISCYIKLKMKDSIKKRIEIASDCYNKGIEPPFDPKVAVEVLDSANWDDDALTLATVCGMHETVIKLLSESNQIKKICDFLPYMQSSVLESVILEHGTLIFNTIEKEQRDKILNFLATACIYGINNDEKQRCDFSVVSSVLSSYPKYYFDFISLLNDIDSKSIPQDIWNDYLTCSIKVKPEQLTTILKNPDANYSSDEVLIILKDDYIRLCKISNDQKKKPDPNINIDEIKKQIKYEEEAIKILYDKRGTVLDILDITEVEELPLLCKLYSGQNIVVRECLQKALLSKNEKVITELVDLIHEKNLIPTNVMFSILIKSAFVSFQCISKYIKEDMKSLQEEIQDKKQKLNSLDTELQNINQSIDKINCEYLTIYPEKCKLCEMKIDRPSKHFLCGHSFHVGCLGDEQNICPICKETYLSDTQSELKSIQESKLNDNVIPLLENSENPIETLSMLVKGSYFDLDGEHEKETTEFFNQINQNE